MSEHNHNETDENFRRATALVALVILPFITGFVLVGRWAMITASVMLVGSMLGLLQLSWGLVGMLLGMELVVGVLVGLCAGVAALRKVRQESHS